MDKLIIIGASGHGKVVADIAQKCGYKEIVFLDDNLSVRQCLGIPVVGPTGMVSALEGDLFIAVGNAEARKRLMEREKGRFFPNLIHPSAIIAESVQMGAGSVIMAGAVINPAVKLGDGCIVNTCASVDHDCVLGDFVHIAVGAHLCGNVIVGASTWIGAGAMVINNIDICGECKVGAGSVVIRNIAEPGVYYGVPARKSKR